jgi:Ser/Thr protein kinase RdoA (MazF antagonist)
LALANLVEHVGLILNLGARWIHNDLHAGNVT